MNWDLQKKGGSEFRSAPFWAWNGRLTPEEVRRQVRVMHAMGMGGFFMHSRVGLDTPYLGPEWFRCIDAAVDEAEKLGMLPGLYDEDRWPSGAAGGLVTMEPAFRMRYLEHEFVDAEHPATTEGETLGWFAVEPDGVEVKAYRAVSGPEEAPGETCLRIFRSIEASNPNYNGGAYLDTMNPQAVDAFIDSTYECYYRHFGDRFGAAVPWIFTDEPNYLDLIDRKRRPWTDRVPELYQQTYGESLLPYLPELFYHCGKKFSTVRYRYYELVTRLLRESFGKRIGEWCERHHIAWTGHLLREDTLSYQVCSIGDAMPFYEYMQQPGMDLLTERWMALNTAKQLSSAGHQLGKKRLLTETYGCTGWDFPLEGHRVLGDWQYVLGVNFRCQHLYWYTMAGSAKRDYPASIGEQSPWHPAYSAVEDYFERLGRVLADGEVQAPLLVVHPIESVWGRAGRYDDHLSFAPDLDGAFGDLTAQLLGTHLDFEFGNEVLMAKHGSVQDGRIVIGRAAYREVLIPQLDTIRTSTLELLEKFAAAGGKVHYVGEAPHYCDGAADPAGRIARAYAQFTPWDQEAVAARLRPVSIRDAAGEARSVFARVSRHADGTVSAFLVNLGCVPDAGTVFNAPWVADRTLAVPGAAIRLPGAPGMTVVQADLCNGRLTEEPARYENGAYCFTADFAPRASRLFLLLKPGTAAVLPAATRSAQWRPVPATLDGVRRSEPNVLVLDHAECRVNGETLKATYVLDLDTELRKKLGGEPRGGAMFQPWTQPKSPDAPTLPVQLTYEFFCKVRPAGPVELVLEGADSTQIFCNGAAVANRVEGYWMDPALSCVKIPAALLREGKNEITLELPFRLTHSGLEAIYLRGEFGVEQEATLTALPERLDFASVTTQQMPYYAGNLEYALAFDLAEPSAVRCRIPAWRGSHVEAAFDDGPAQPCLGEPWEFVSDRKLAPGKHTVKITVYGSRRNACGPFYLDKKTHWVGPFEFVEKVPGGKKVAEFGLMAKPEIAAETENGNLQIRD